MSFITAILLASATAVNASGSLSESNPVVREFPVCFRWDNTTHDRSYLGGGVAVDSLTNLVARVGADNIRYVEVVAYASPEGDYEHNMNLSRNRALELKTLLSRNIPELADRMYVSPGGEAWALLHKRIEDDTSLSAESRNKILRVLDDSSLSLNSRKWRLSHSLGTDRAVGDLWKYLLHEHYRYLRCGEIRLYLLEHHKNDNKKSSSKGDFRFTDEFGILYRQNRTEIDPSYLWNPSRIGQLRNFLQRDILVDSITVYSYASPEGHNSHNDWLSSQRALKTKKFIVEQFKIDPSRVRICDQGENWPGLRQAVSDYYKGYNREELLGILNSDSLTDMQRKDRIVALDEGRTYAYLIDAYMPPLRNAVLETSWSRKDRLDLPKLAWSGDGLASFQNPYQIQLPQAQQSTIGKRTIVALKTNLLYDAVTAINYQIEVPVGKSFSVVWEHYFPWWTSKRELKYCFQYLTLGGEARWWFAPKPRTETKDRVLRDVLVGHFVGVYGLWGKADLQWQDKFGMYQCSPILSAGLTYGYSTPITKRLNLELSISAGYARIPYQHYIPSEDWQILWRDRDDAGITHYVGPTKIAATLSNPILVNSRPRRR